MGKPTGFMEYDRCEARSVEPKERIKNFNDVPCFLSKENQQKQAARCMDCGVPFCQSGMTIAGMTSGCPLHNLVPEWNDLVYTGNWDQAERAANNPWPEWPKVLKTDYGQEEAIACFGTDPRIYQTTVKEFHKDKNGKLNGLTIVRLESKVDEKTGRRNMVEVAGSEKKIPAELVLIAAGFLGTEEYIAKAFGVELNQRTNVATEPGTYATNVKNVFVAGDMHRGQSLVVWAIREAVRWHMTWIQV